MNQFGAVLEFFLSWLPQGLYTPVMGVIAVAFLIIAIKVLIAVVEVAAKLFVLFVGG